MGVLDPDSPGLKSGLKTDAPLLLSQPCQGKTQMGGDRSTPGIHAEIGIKKTCHNFGTPPCVLSPLRDEGLSWGVGPVGMCLETIQLTWG